MSVVEHKGVVKRVVGDQIQVQIMVSSACDGCHMKGGCVSSNSSGDRVVTVKNSDAKSYNVGQDVTLFFSEKMGGRVVIIAYIIPVIICVLAIIILSNIGVSEPISALCALLFILSYFLTLYANRDKLESKIKISIKK